MWDELKKLLKHTTIYGVGGLLSKAVGFVLIPFYTHYLSAAQYGTLELLDLSLTLTGLLLNVVVAGPLVRFYYDYEEEKEKRKIVSTAMLTAILAALPVSLAGVVFATRLSVLILKSPEFAVCLRVISVSFLLLCLNSVAWNYLRARQQSVVIVSVNLITLVVTLSLNIFFIAYLHMGVLGVLWSGLVGQVLTSAIIGVQTFRQVGLGFDFGKLRAIAAFGAPLLITNLGAFALNFSDRFFLQHYRTTSVVGVYALGYKFGFMLNFLLVQPFFMIWPPRMYALAKKEDARETVSRFGDYFCLILATGVVGLSVAIKDVIRITAGPEFQAAYRVVPLVALAYLCQGMASYFQVPLYLTKKTSYIALAGAISGLAALALNFLLIPKYGAMGAAWATFLSFGLLAILAYAISQKLYRVPYRISRLCMPVVLAVVAYMASDLIKISSPLWSAAARCMVVPAFLATVCLFRFFDKKEVEKLKSLLGTLTRYRLGTVVPSEKVG